MVSFKRVINFLVIVPFTFFNTAIATLAEETKIPEQELLIWRVDPHPGSIYSVYILGSYHVGKECQINSPVFEHAFKDAETVVFEVDSLLDSESITQESQQYISKLIRQKGIPRDSSNSLQEILDAETYELLKEKTAAIDFPIDNFARLKPWVFVFAFSSYLLTQTEYKPECGLDLMTAKLAESEGKNTAGLETLEYQLDKYTDLFVSLESDEILETLSATAELESTEKLSEYFTNEFDSLTNAIDSGNLEDLKSYIDDWCDSDAEECESLLFTRNRNWIPKIERLLNQNKDSLVVVGAGHMVGEESVIELLKQEGYRVRRFHNSFRLTEE